MNPGILFAIVAALAFGIWTVFHDQAANYIDHLFGAIVVSLTAVIIGLIFLFGRLRAPSELISHPKGLIFAALAGVCALAIDYFALKTYGAGLAVSVGGPIIIGGSVAVAAVIGFFLGESITLLKIVGLLLVIAGSGVLAAVSG